MRESGKIVDEYRIDLAWNKTLDKVTLLDSAQHMVDELNDAEIVKTYKEMSKKIESSLDVSMIQRCSIFHKILMSTGEYNYLHLDVLSSKAVHETFVYFKEDGWKTAHVSFILTH